MEKRVEAIKYDQEKPQIGLIAPSLIEALGQVLSFGAKKYSPHNWRRGFIWSRPFNSLMRHMWSWWNGEDKDSETGMSHLWHAAACLMMLIEFEVSRTGQDDRSHTFLKSLEAKDE